MSQVKPADSERTAIPTVSLRIRLLLVAVFLGGVLAVIGPSAADIGGASQEFVRELCKTHASEHHDICK